MIILIIKNKYSKLLNIIEEFSEIEFASLINIDDLKESINFYDILNNQIETKKEFISKLMIDDGLIKVSNNFYKITKPFCDEFKKKYEKAIKDIKDLIISFGEDKMKNDEFFTIFSTFIKDFKKVTSELSQENFQVVFEKKIYFN